MLAAENGRDPRLKAISDAIRVVPHFPKPGIMFHDITTLLLDHKAFKDTVDLFVERYRDMGISIVAVIRNLERKEICQSWLPNACGFGFEMPPQSSHWNIQTRPRACLKQACIEARGFIFGPSIALGIGAKFVPLRKPGKLPGKVISEPYELEYGTDQLEMHIGAVQPGERTIIIDDLVATGGTLSAAIRLLERFQAEIVECACVVGSPVVQGECELKEKPLFVLVEPHH